MATRRSFLKTSASATAGTAAFGVPEVNALGANEVLNIGLIGTGGRCRRLMQSLATIKNVRMAAVCDIYKKHLDLARKIADPKAFATGDYHQLLARKDIDAVLIGSPDHWHVPMTVDACAAGKDVYVEKPLTHDLLEGQKVIDAQNKHKRVVLVGTQQRSMPHFIKAHELVRQGKLGKIHKVHLTWNRNSNRVRRGGKLDVNPNEVNWKAFLGNARKQPFDAYRFRHWRWFWDFGNGILTDLMVHFIDVVHWYLGLDHPETATTIGDNFMSKGIWQTPDTIQTLLKYPGKDLQVYFEGTFVNARNGAMIEFMGSEATLYLDRGRFELHPERGKKIKYQEMVLGEGRRGADFYQNPDGEGLHLQHWIDCIRNRKKTNTPAEAGVSAAAAAHLGNRAFRLKRVEQWPK